WNSPSERPLFPIANSRALSPESLLTHHTPFSRRLDTMPDSSVIASSATLPGVDATSVPLHAAVSTADACGGGFVGVGARSAGLLDADPHPASKPSAAESTANVLRITGRR